MMFVGMSRKTGKQASKFQLIVNCLEKTPVSGWGRQTIVVWSVSFRFRRPVSGCATTAALFNEWF